VSTFDEDDEDARLTAAADLARERLNRTVAALALKRHEAVEIRDAAKRALPYVAVAATSLAVGSVVLVVRQRPEARAHVAFMLGTWLVFATLAALGARAVVRAGRRRAALARYSQPAPSIEVRTHENRKELSNGQSEDDG